MDALALPQLCMWTWHFLQTTSSFRWDRQWWLEELHKRNNYSKAFSTPDSTETLPWTSTVMVAESLPAGLVAMRLYTPSSLSDRLVMVTDSLSAENTTCSPSSCNSTPENIHWMSWNRTGGLAASIENCRVTSFLITAIMFSCAGITRGGTALTKKKLFIYVVCIYGLQVLSYNFTLNFHSWTMRRDRPNEVRNSIRSIAKIHTSVFNSQMSNGKRWCNERVFQQIAILVSAPSWSNTASIRSNHDVRPISCADWHWLGLLLTLKIPVYCRNRVSVEYTSQCQWVCDVFDGAAKGIEKYWRSYAISNTYI